MMRSPATVLFVCVHNAGRSQMAAAFLDKYAGQSVQIRLGGSEPAQSVHPNVVEVMQEVGIDLGEVRPRAFDADDVKEADFVITMGCGDACPIFPGKRYEDWVLDDPHGRPVEEVRPVRDEIRRRVVGLLDSLGVPVA